MNTDSELVEQTLDSSLLLHWTIARLRAELFAARAERDYAQARIKHLEDCVRRLSEPEGR